MGMFKIRSHEKKTHTEAESSTGRFKRNASVNKSGSTRSNNSPPLPQEKEQTPSANDSDTDPATTDSDMSHTTPRRTGSSRNTRNRTALGDGDITPSSEADKDAAFSDGKDATTGTKSSSHSRKSNHKKRSKQESSPKAKSSSSPHHPHISPTYEYYARQAINPFANKGEVYLCHDMAMVADAMKLDLNTQVMLAYYDAKSLEDFCLMAESDLRDLVARAQAMRRAIPPLQLRKIQVLREWVQEISTPQDDSRLPAWILLSQKKSKRKSKKLIPEDWKAQFIRDLPRLKHQLRKKGENLSTFPFCSFVPSFQSISMCGLVK